LPLEGEVTDENLGKVVETGRGPLVAALALPMSAAIAKFDLISLNNNNYNPMTV